MLLPPQDAELFFKLHGALMLFVSQRLQVIPDSLATPEEFAALPQPVQMKVRDALVDRSGELTEAFVAQNPAQLPDDELAIVSSWRHLVAGKFYIFRELKNYTVFLTTKEQAIAYGVLALTQPFEELIGPGLPVLTQTILLPFKDRIVYDGLLNRYNITFGPGIRRSLNESFKEAKVRHGIVTSLPFSANSMVPLARTPKAKPRPKASTKEKTTEILGIILTLIEGFCRRHLNSEYLALCRQLAEKLARKRPSPLLNGQPATWASGIVRAIGYVNFLDDSSQKLHMRMTDIDQGFGVSQASGSAKAKAIRDLLKLRRFDPDWTVPSRMESNPLVWMLSVNGFLMDIRHAPREAQVAAFEKGLIPYIPADQQK